MFKMNNIVSQKIYSSTKQKFSWGYFFTNVADFFSFVKFYTFEGPTLIQDLKLFRTDFFSSLSGPPLEPYR